jgi:hypothetical protein
MLPREWEEWLAQKEKEIKQAPNPPKRRQPKIMRHQSPRQRGVGQQSNNVVHSVYKEDGNKTPLAPRGFVGTRDLGGNAEERNGAPTGTRTSYRSLDESDNKKDK